MQPPVLAYPTRDGHFVLSTDASDTEMCAVLEQEQEEGGRVVKRVIAYVSKNPMRGRGNTALRIRSYWLL